MVANWNVRTLQVTWLEPQRRTELIACERAKHNTDIAALSETRFFSRCGNRLHVFLECSSKICHSHSCRWICSYDYALAEHSRISISIDERLMTLSLPLAKFRIATFASVYAPTLNPSGDAKDRFYDTLYSILRKTSLNDMFILMDDFNAKFDGNHKYGKVSLVITVLA